jgi:hypothetical protein
MIGIVDLIAGTGDNYAELTVRLGKWPVWH